MDQITDTSANVREIIKEKLRQHFDGKIVRKDLTKKIKEGANVTVNLNIKKNAYEAEFSNLGLKGIPMSDEYPEKYDRLLCGGIWCILQLEYEYIEIINTF